MPSIKLPERPRNRRERHQQLRAADGKDEDQSSDDKTPLPISSFSSSAKPAPFWAEDVGFFDPGFQAEPEYGNTIPRPVVNASKHVYYLNIFIFVDRLKELARKHGAEKVIDLIPSYLRGSALIWWTVEVDKITKELLEGSKRLEQ